MYIFRNEGEAKEKERFPPQKLTFGPPRWRSGEGRCTAAPAVPPETLGSRPGSVVTGCAREVRGAARNWPSVVRVREGLDGRDILVSSRTSDSCGGPSTVLANQGCQVHGVSSDTLVWLAPGLDTRCVKKQCGLVGLCIGGRMTFNLRLSRARLGVAAMRQDMHGLRMLLTIGYHEIITTLTTSIITF